MNAVFLGGGSLRLLPIFRGIFSQVPEFFKNGEIRLVDRKLERAEAVGKLIMACPEYEQVNCKVVWTDQLESVLPGTDLLYLTMAARREPSESQSVFISNRYNYYSSDNLSINGAFLSLRIGRTIFEIAKKMEVYCPNALMLIFPNPVSVYAHLVNTHTKIRALGICGGFTNHRWDLTRLTGRNEYDAEWKTVAAGINHLSYILRGSWRGQDLYSEVLPRYLTDNWKPIDIPYTYKWQRDGYYYAQLYLYRMFKRYSKVIFSTESDGSVHLFPDEEIACQTRRWGTGADFDPVAVGAKAAAGEKERFERFIASSKNPGTIDWKAPGGYYGMNSSDITIPIFRALAGTETMRIVASRPNYGAVRDFAPDMPLEYTMDICGSTITPVEDQYIPDPFFGLTSALSDFQRLQSEAIAAWDPQIFADALDAYPVHQFSEKRKAYFREMFDLYSDIDPVMLDARKYFL